MEKSLRVENILKRSGAAVMGVGALALFYNGSSSEAVSSIGPRTKSIGCVALNALPDSACTPGAVFGGVTKQQICIRRYSKTVRNVPASKKGRVYSEYGITRRSPGEYEVDHLISLELGGSNDIANLWPEAATPIPGFHQKDQEENYLHKEVCKGLIPLAQAQEQIASDWLKLFQSDKQSLGVG